MPAVGKLGGKMGCCYREYMHKKDKAEGGTNKYPKCVFGKGCRFCHNSQPDQELLKKWEEKPPLNHDQLTNPPKLVAAPAKERVARGAQRSRRTRTPSVSSRSDQSSRSYSSTSRSSGSRHKQSGSSSSSRSSRSDRSGRRGRHGPKNKGSPARERKDSRGREHRRPHSKPRRPPPRRRGE